MRFFFTILVCLLSFSIFAQDDARKLQETAKTFTRQGDYTNAILVLNRAASLSPNDPAIQKEIAYNYFLNGEYDQAAAFIKPLTEKEDADIQTFQIAGTIYKGKNDRKNRRQQRLCSIIE